MRCPGQCRCGSTRDAISLDMGVFPEPKPDSHSDIGSIFHVGQDPRRPSPACLQLCLPPPAPQ